MHFEDLLPNLMMLAGMSLVVVILMRRLYRRRRKNNQAAASQAQAARSYSQPLLDAPPEISRWQVEMHEVSRELRAELDSKAVMVQTLLAMLREEVDRLEALLAQTDARRMAPQPQAGDADLLAEIRRLAAEIAADRGEADHAVASQAADERIYQLADQGCAADEIARQLSLAQGEVELALSLRSP